MFLNQVENIFALRTLILLPKCMFSSLASRGNTVSRNNVSATMFPSLARPLIAWINRQIIYFQQIIWQTYIWLDGNVMLDNSLSTEVKFDVKCMSFNVRFVDGCILKDTS